MSVIRALSRLDFGIVFWTVRDPKLASPVASIDSQFTSASDLSPLRRRRGVLRGHPRGAYGSDIERIILRANGG